MPTFTPGQLVRISTHPATLRHLPQMTGRVGVVAEVELRGQMPLAFFQEIRPGGLPGQMGWVPFDCLTEETDPIWTMVLDTYEHHLNLGRQHTPWPPPPSPRSASQAAPEVELAYGLKKQLRRVRQLQGLCRMLEDAVSQQQLDGACRILGEVEQRYRKYRISRKERS